MICPSYDLIEYVSGKGKSMFLIRTAFWLTLIILLLPTNEQDQRNVYGTAEAAVKDLRTFCVRNPGVCEKGENAFGVFAEKARFGARMLMDFVSDVAADGPVEIASVEKDSKVPASFRRNSQNTLTNDDMRPSWSGPSSNSGI